MFIPARQTRRMQDFRATKIVATLGPASSDHQTLRALIEAGVNVVRLNFSHGSHKEKAALISTVREIEEELGRPIGVLQDVQGPKIRVGTIPEGRVELEPGQALDIYGDGRPGGLGFISTNYAELSDAVTPGDAIFLDDGNIELRVDSLIGELVRCEVVIGGPLSTGKGVNLPGARLNVSALTEKDREDINFGMEHGVDFVALSFVRSPKDAEAARQAMRSSGRTVPLLAKVEKREAVDLMGSVLRSFDGSMVARGDLGVELRPENVPSVQKQLIARSLALGRPVITATQMLESMTYNRRPTRAEASDVANAVLDGTHAVMLSGETAIGSHPVEVVRAMHRIIVEAEHLVRPKALNEVPLRSPAHAVSLAAAKLARDVDASGLAAFTRSGRTARTLSSLQPSRPIIAFCESLHLARQLCLWRGVVPIMIAPGYPGEIASTRMERELIDRRLFPSGSTVISLGAAQGSRAGQTNFIRLLKL